MRSCTANKSSARRDRDYEHNWRHWWTSLFALPRLNGMRGFMELPSLCFFDSSQQYPSASTGDLCALCRLICLHSCLYHRRTDWLSLFDASLIPALQLTDLILGENNHATTTLGYDGLFNVFKCCSIPTGREVSGLENSRKAEEVT
jgi:hypothetical protein